MRRLGTFLHCLVLFWSFWLLQFMIVSEVTEKEILLQFKGNITSDPYNSLSSWDPSGSQCQDFSGVFCNSAGNVERIVLWNTSLGGVLSPALSGLQSLRILTLFGNKFTGNIPVEFGQIDTLWKINMSSNAFSGSIPEFLGNLPNIRFLDLSKNGYTGDIPSDLFKDCGRTRFVAVGHNNLSGSIPLSIANCLNLEGLDLSFNSLSGGFPSEICSIPGLVYLSLRSNAFVGRVLEQVSECGTLEVLDIGSNMFTGEPPFGILSFPNITNFNISNNGFQGEIPNVETCSDKLEFFDVSGNGLYGDFPVSITNCSALKYLDLGSNRLSGSIPPTIANLKQLLVARFGNNLIEGVIPTELGSVELLQVLDLHNLEIGGQIPDEISNCRFLLELNISGNSLSGEIPQNLYNMTYLLILDLHHNQLTGSIPSTLGDLSNIRVLDLSENLLSGFIPSSLGNSMNLTHFNVSYNNLSGAIPESQGILQFGASAFSHNPGLCGDILGISCTTVGPSRVRKPKLSASAIVSIIAAALIFIGVCVITIINMRAHRRENEEETPMVESTQLQSSDSNVIIGKLVLFSNSLPSKYEDWEAGTKALLDKECLIGGGTIGTVYKANFENGISIAVKKLETLGRIKTQDEFEQEVGRLGSLLHPNLVSFQGYYWSTSMHLLLFEFVPKGNLYDNLHGHSYPGTSSGAGNPDLYWSRRFQIALGTARALAYLHHDCKPPILHLNMKSANILLDGNYQPKLSDYGLLKLLPLLDSYGVTKFHNAVGYVAPEMSQSLRPDEKCDVYSFGMILLELVTGRKPVESSSPNDVAVLREYVKGSMERGAAFDCFDRRLRGFADNELIQVMRLGLICTSDVPLKRPSMAEVVQVLETIRNGTGT